LLPETGLFRLKLATLYSEQAILLPFQATSYLSPVSGYNVARFRRQSRRLRQQNRLFPDTKSPGSYIEVA